MPPSADFVLSELERADLPDGVECKKHGSDRVSCNFSLNQDDHHSAVSSFSYSKGMHGFEYRVHWVDGPEAREVVGEDGWYASCGSRVERPESWSVSYRGDGDRLRHIVCDHTSDRQANLHGFTDALKETWDRFNG